MFKNSILHSAAVKILRQGWVKLSDAVKNFMTLSFRDVTPTFFPKILCNRCPRQINWWLFLTRTDLLFLRIKSSIIYTKNKNRMFTTIPPTLSSSFSFFSSLSFLELSTKRNFVSGWWAMCCPFYDEYLAERYALWILSTAREEEREICKRDTRYSVSAVSCMHE